MWVVLDVLYGGVVLLFEIIVCVGSAGVTVWEVCVVVWDNTV